MGKTQNFGKVLLNDYWYSASGNETFTDKEKEVIFGNSNGNRYWLASRGVCVLAGRGFTGFGPGGVLGDTVNSSNYLFDSYGVGTGYELSLRAVVPLKSDIPGIVE